MVPDTRVLCLVVCRRAQPDWSAEDVCFEVLGEEGCQLAFFGDLTHSLAVALANADANEPDGGMIGVDTNST